MKKSMPNQRGVEGRGGRMDTDRKELKYPHYTKISNHLANHYSFPPRLVQLPSFKGQMLVNL